MRVPILKDGDDLARVVDHHMDQFRETMVSSGAVPYLALGIVVEENATAGKTGTPVFAYIHRMIETADLPKILRTMADLLERSSDGKTKHMMITVDGQVMPVVDDPEKWPEEAERLAKRYVDRVDRSIRPCRHAAALVMEWFRRGLPVAIVEHAIDVYAASCDALGMPSGFRKTLHAFFEDDGHELGQALLSYRSAKPGPKNIN